MDQLTQVLAPLLTLGAPGLLALIAALLWDRKQLQKSVAEERQRTERLVELMVKLNEKLLKHSLEDDSTQP